ncbi:hypothetical protein [Burkholderia stagnalis]
MTRSRFVRFSSRCTRFAVGLFVVRLAAGATSLDEVLRVTGGH